MNQFENKRIARVAFAAFTVIGLIACQQFSSRNEVQESVNNTGHATASPLPTYYESNQISQALEQGQPRNKSGVPAPLDPLATTQSRLKEAQGIAATSISQAKTAIYQRDEAQSALSTSISAQSTTIAERDAYLITAQTAVASSNESNVTAANAMSQTERLIHMVQTLQP